MGFLPEQGCARVRPGRGACPRAEDADPGCPAVGYSAAPNPVMTDPSADLEVRHVRLAERAVLQPTPLESGEEGVFVAHDEPPPVRTILTVVQDDRRRALEVVRVVEVTHGDEPHPRGLVGRWIDDEALVRAAKVGTEHLDDGTPVVQPVYPDNSRALPLSDAHAMSMPMPAPVVMIDGDDEAREDADGGHPTAESGAAEEPEADAPSPDGEPVTASEPEAGAPLAAVEADAGTSPVSSAEPQPDPSPSEASSSGSRRSRGGAKKKRGRKKR